MRLRVSVGSAMVLGLANNTMACLPSTCYIMLGEACRGNCGFCAQARGGGGNRLSRVVWPVYSIDEILSSLEDVSMERFCIQTLDYPGMVEELSDLASVLSEHALVSAAVNPLSVADMEMLKSSGVERLGIGLDAASKSIFEAVKGPGVGGHYSWDDTLEAILSARDVFGHAVTHIIVGLGETDRDVVDIMLYLRDRGVEVSLFAATPVKGAWLSVFPPSLGRYRSLQASRALLGCRGFSFSEEGRLSSLPDSWRSLGGEAFMTRGCPGCNRPYYNEVPGEEPFNYPCMPGVSDTEKVFEDIAGYVGG